MTDAWHGSGGVPLADWMARHQTQFERVAAQSLPEASGPLQTLHRSMRYAVLDGGKRIRPLLAYAAGEAAQAPATLLDPIALALECIHAYSLVHDDMPCMDNDVLRRGKPTTHVAFGEAGALLAGDALQTEAFRQLLRAPADAPRLVRLLQTLAEAAGASGMCGGQSLDLEALNQQLAEADLQRMHGLKTGALLRASVLMGAQAGDLDERATSSLDRYATSIGLAFQVIDDVLDVESDSSELGKTAGKDHDQNKPTYVSVLGVQGARDRAAGLLQHAQDALRDSGLAPARCLRLGQLADLIVARRH